MNFKYNVLTFAILEILYNPTKYQYTIDTTPEI